MPIVHTRYRDIPWEEVAKCVEIYEGAPSWSSLRGQPFRIHTPALPYCLGAKCEGPFYRVDDGTNEAVCPHIAEIGD